MNITLKPSINKSTTYADLMYYVMRGVLTISEISQQFKKLGIKQ